MSFDVNGKDTICHHTGSAQHPFTILKTSQQGCIDGHAQHPQDYVAVGDPTCQGGGCLPQGAPCDASLPCCSGSTCQSGTCVSACACDTTVESVFCSSDGVTYDNLCFAECAGATGCSFSCACDTTFLPVTCSNGVTYGNQCFADCAGATGCA